MFSAKVILVVAAAVIVGIDVYWAKQLDFPQKIYDRLRQSLNIWQEKNFTPRMPYKEFRSIVESNGATSRFERVKLVDSNYAGIYFEVKEKGQTGSYRVYVPSDARDGLFDKLAAKGILVDFEYSCI